MKQSLMGNFHSSHDPTCSILCTMDVPNPVPNNPHNHAVLLPQSPAKPSSQHYIPYPKPSNNSFHDQADSPIPCLHCGFKGHKVLVCMGKHSNCHKCPI